MASRSVGAKASSNIACYKIICENEIIVIAKRVMYRLVFLVLGATTAKKAVNQLTELKKWRGLIFLFSYSVKQLETLAVMITLTWIAL